jgi:hypothetical protein
MSLTNKLLPLNVAVFSSFIAFDAKSAVSNDKNAVPGKK